MHGFDVGKILIDKDGYPATSTDPATLAEYERKVLCLRTAYQAVEQERQFTSIDPTYDSEGFADWAGLELAYSAYRSLPAAERDAAIPGLRLTAEQLFFVTHCFKWCGYTKQRLAGNRYWASRTRCVGPARQLAEFARAFACRPNSRMNPQTRCTFF
ncbi:neprilysin-2-like [Haemaphysalis longicornis]